MIYKDRKTPPSKKKGYQSWEEIKKKIKKKNN